MLRLRLPTRPRVAPTSNKRLLLPAEHQQGSANVLAGKTGQRRILSQHLLIGLNGLFMPAVAQQRRSEVSPRFRIHTTHLDGPAQMLDSLVHTAFEHQRDAAV